MKKSDHNILTEVGAGQWLIANVLTGTADLLTASEADHYEHGRFDEIPGFKERGYLVDEQEEASSFQKAYIAFLKERETDEVQIFYVPSYACNFSCSYCYQAEYTHDGAPNNEVLQAFFKYVDRTFSKVPKYLTLFGGEPLMPGAAHKRQVARFFELAKERGLDSAVVTNGYHLLEYIDILEKAVLREVQVTLDGTRAIHDSRRPLKAGGGTFERIVQGIDALLERNIPVNLRLVMDRGNIKALPELSTFAKEKGWLEHPSFKTQLGRNYALHHCAADASSLFERIEMDRAVAEMMQEHPHIAQFHKPHFHLAKTLGESGTLPPPNFDACPGTKTEWAFDYTGRIYSCTATVGKQDECLGTFYPEVKLDEEAILEWQDRDVLAIEKCRSCNVRLVCGGGCGSLAKNRNGSLHSPDCRPVAESTAVGAAFYLKNDLTS